VVNAVSEIQPTTGPFHGQLLINSTTQWQKVIWAKNRVSNWELVNLSDQQIQWAYEDAPVEDRIFVLDEFGAIERDEDCQEIWVRKTQEWECRVEVRFMENIICSGDEDRLNA